MHRFTRAARNRVKPRGTRIFHEVNRHHGDEFDELIKDPGHLTVVPVRKYVPRVPQSFDEFNEAVDHEPVGRLNQLGTLIEGAIPVVTDSKAFESYMAAFDKRSNSQPDAGQDCSPLFQKRALKLWDQVFSVLHFDHFDVDEPLFDQWLSKQDPPKRVRMRKAMDEMFACENDSSYLGEKSLSVKIESLLKRYDPKWAPRLIYAGNDHFNALTGPVAMVICDRLKEIFDRVRLGPIKFKMAYKTNDVDLAQHLRDGYDSGHTECFEADFSANDLRQLPFVAVVFDKVCQGVGAPTWFRALLMDVREFRVKNLAFGHRAQLAHQLPTGTTITTPRNTVWNATIEGVYAQQEENEGEADVLGDDFLGVFANPVDKTHAEEFVTRETGMKLTAAGPRLSGEATFLSRRLAIDTETPCMMPKLGKALARFNVRVSKNEAISNSAYMAGKALSYAYEFRHFPLFRDVFMDRYRLEEDRASIVLSEVSWFTKTSGVSLDQLENSIMEEQVLVSEDCTREFLMDSYGDTFGLVPAMDITKRVVLGLNLEIIDAPTELSVDWM